MSAATSLSPAPAALSVDFADEFDAPSIDVSSYFSWKHLLDRAIAALLLIPAAPVILVLALVVRMTSRGPGIFSQRRVGRAGRTFTMYKIRTMVADAEVGTGAIWSAPGDPRMTRLGRLLRKTHMDELPQLWNVLRGEMSLVGPRPERPEFTTVLIEQIPEYVHRLKVLPGVTGLAQVNLPPDTDLDSVRRKVILDCEYVRKAGWWLDFRILAYTSFRLTGVPSGWLTRAFGLYRTIGPLPASRRDPVMPTSAECSTDGARHAKDSRESSKSAPQAVKARVRAR